MNAIKCFLILWSALPLLAASRPSLYLVGDSIMRTGSGTGDSGPWGMGSELIEFFDPARIQVFNEALGCRRSQSFYGEDAWKKVRDRLQPGDFVLVAFGHNDARNSQAHPDRTTLPGNGDDSLVQGGETIHSYGWYLRQYAREARDKGATAILCSPAPRATWVEGRIKRGLDGYASWAADAARTSGARFLDLNTLAANRWDSLGQQKAADYFADLEHTTKAGARLNAEAIVEGIRGLTDCKLAEALRSEAPPGPAVVALPPTLANDLPAIYVVGDSSAAESNRVLTNQGWGVPFLRYFDPARIRAVNAAKGGRSSRTFITEGLMDAVVACLKPADTVLIQLGHNDVFPTNDDRAARGTLHGIGEETEEIDNLVTRKHEVVHTYGWYLRKMIADVRSKGAQPVILTLTVRYRWNPDGTIERALRPGLDISNGNRFDDPSIYSVWAKQVAAQTKTPVIDLHEMIADRYDQDGPDAVSQYFNNSGDPVHTNPMGAKITAELALRGLKALLGARLDSYLSTAGKSVATAASKYILF
jgi:lysophospholipase L1-like esterase